jgi:hypothetical protein
VVGALSMRALEIEKAVEARFAQQLAEVDRKKKSEIAAAVKAATKALRDGQARVVAAAVAAEREKSGKAVAEAVIAEKIAHATDRARLEADLSLLQKKLAALPAHKIGEPAEIDLFDSLVAAFPGDQISRVAKGVKGPDVVMDVVIPSGDIAGRVILDSKAHARWSNKFTTKLRSDQLNAKADFAILVSSAFPAGTRELHLQDGVLVISPSRVVTIVAFLRQQIIANRRLRLSAEARDEKGDRLLAYLTTEGHDHFGRLEKAANDLIDLEAKQIDMETGFHRKRGEMIRAVQCVHEELLGEIDRIIAGNEPLEIEALA